MRKPRDFDAELQALTDKARALKTRKQGQLGELVLATGADALSIEQLAGALMLLFKEQFELVVGDVTEVDQDLSDAALGHLGKLSAVSDQQSANARC